MLNFTWIKLVERVGQELDNPDSGAIALPVIPYSTAAVHGAQYLENHFISYASGFTCVFCLFVLMFKKPKPFYNGLCCGEKLGFFSEVLISIENVVSFAP